MLLRCSANRASSRNHRATLSPVLEVFTSASVLGRRGLRLAPSLRSLLEVPPQHEEVADTARPAIAVKNLFVSDELRFSFTPGAPGCSTGRTGATSRPVLANAADRLLTFPLFALCVASETGGRLAIRDVSRIWRRLRSLCSLLRQRATGSTADVARLRRVRFMVGVDLVTAAVAWTRRPLISEFGALGRQSGRRSVPDAKCSTSGVCERRRRSWHRSAVRAPYVTSRSARSSQSSWARMRPAVAVGSWWSADLAGGVRDQSPHADRGSTRTAEFAERRLFGDPSTS